MRKACLEEIFRLAKKDKRIVFVGSDLTAGVLSDFKKEMPDRFFMEGVSEQAIIGMASGMAKEGKIVYVNTIATFITRRCFEQNMLDLGLHKMKVRLIGSGGGLVYAPLGPTHLAIDDIAIMRTIPNMGIVVPADAREMVSAVRETVDFSGPLYIRVAKGNDRVVVPESYKFNPEKAYLAKRGKDVFIITTGITLQIALEAAEILKIKGIKPSILHIPMVKPIDAESIVKWSNSDIAVTIEEHLRNGGLGSMVAEIFADNGIKTRLVRIGLRDMFPEGYGSQKDMMEREGITAGKIVHEVLNQE